MEMEGYMEIRVRKWHSVSDEGYPEDGDVCFIATKTDGDAPDGWLIGGYNEDENVFYADFGLGGMVTDAEDVIFWAHMEDTEFAAD